jgi:transaldolase
LWASTSRKNPAYSDTLYVDHLIGPDTVNTLAENAMRAFEDHGTLARTIDHDPAGAENVVRALSVAAAIDMDAVGHTLEDQGIAAFQASYNHALLTLGAKANTLLER